MFKKKKLIDYDVVLFCYVIFNFNVLISENKRYDEIRKLLEIYFIKYRLIIF